jgi:hypothetical protein
MAEFSKQWAEINDPGFGWDFDIEEVSNQLDPNHYVPMICEGFGFIAIGRDENYKVLLAMPTGETETDENGQISDKVIWQAYEDVVK